MKLKLSVLVQDFPSAACPAAHRSGVLRNGLQGEEGALGVGGAGWRIEGTTSAGTSVLNQL